MDNANKILGYIFRISITLAHKTLIFLGKLIELILKTFFAILAGTAATQAATTQHNASFKDNPGELISYFNRGIRFGDKATSIETSTRHTIIFGSPGSSKSLSVIVPTLLSSKGEKSYVVRDPAGELYKLCSGYLKKQGYDVRVINLSQAHLSSDAWNPLEGSLTDGDLNRLAELVVASNYGTSEGDAYWRHSAKELAFVMMKILKEQPAYYHNFYNLKRLVEKFASDDSALDPFIAKSTDEDLKLAYASIIAIPDKTRLSTVATLKSSLSSFADNDLAQVSANTTFDWSITRNKPTCIFVQSSVLDDKYLNLYQSVLFFRLMNDLMKEVPKTGLPVAILIDESSSLSLGGFLETILATSRKYKISIVLVYQGYSQMERTYTKAGAESIMACCYSKLYMAGQTLSTAQELEQLLGKTEVTDENGKKTIQPLMSAYNIRTMNQGEGLLLCGNHPAILLQTTPYYKTWRFKERSKISPLEINPITQQILAKLPL